MEGILKKLSSIKNIKYSWRIYNMKPKLNIITLAVNDLEKSIAFYKDGLGLPTERLVKGADHIIFENENIIIRTF